MGTKKSSFMPSESKPYEVQVVMFSSADNAEECVQYLTSGGGVCAKAQELLLQFPPRKRRRVLKTFITTISKVNKFERCLCPKMQLALICQPWGKELFLMYISQMQKFFCDEGIETRALMPHIAWVAKKKGWL